MTDRSSGKRRRVDTNNDETNALDAVKRAVERHANFAHAKTGLQNQQKALLSSAYMHLASVDGDNRDSMQLVRCVFHSEVVVLLHQSVTLARSANLEVV